MPRCELEVIFRIYGNATGAFLELSPHPDGQNDGTFWRLHTPSAEGKEYFGNIDLSMDASVLRALCVAIENALDSDA